MATNDEQQPFDSAPIARRGADDRPEQPVAQLAADLEEESANHCGRSCHGAVAERHLSVQWLMLAAALALRAAPPSQQAAQVRADEQAAWIVEKVDAKLGAGWALKLAEQLHGVSYGPPSALTANSQQVASGEKLNE